MTLEERVAELERRLAAIVPERLTEFWIVQSETESLAYWGPCRTPEEARSSSLFRPEFGCRIIELPRAGTGRLPSAKQSNEEFRTLVVSPRVEKEDAA